MRNLTELTDDQLAGVAAEAFRTGDTATQDAVEHEADRRDRRDANARRSRERWAAVRQAWTLWTENQVAQAEAACRGNLLSKAGRAAGVDPWSLWSGRSSVAVRYASEELLEFWAVSPRVTVTEYRQQMRRLSLAA